MKQVEIEREKNERRRKENGEGIGEITEKLDNRERDRQRQTRR